MAEERLKDELQNITEQITKGHHFLLSGGAGSGKTYTLVQVVKWIIENYPFNKWLVLHIRMLPLKK